MEPEGVTRALVMSDVAARAGVSHQTVSRVVNGHPHVAPATRERVQRAIEELGYRPNTAARALVTGSTRTLGLVTSHLNQYGPAQTLIGLEQAARAATSAIPGGRVVPASVRTTAPSVRSRPGAVSGTRRRGACCRRRRRRRAAAPGP